MKAGGIQKDTNCDTALSNNLLHTSNAYTIYITFLQSNNIVDWHANICFISN
jgi:hypothetical protein